MKILDKLIDVVTWTDEKGNIRPVRFRLQNDDESYTVVKVDRLLGSEIHKVAGNVIILFRCQSIINGAEKLFELKYVLASCKWYLWKM